MGLKTTNYEVKKIGITISEAYAKFIQIDLDKDGNVKAFLAIQQTREDFESLQALELHEFNFIADKDLPIYLQAYEFAKANGFSNWEDDIVEEIPPSTIVNETLEEV